MISVMDWLNKKVLPTCKSFFILAFMMFVLVLNEICRFSGRENIGHQLTANCPRGSWIKFFLLRYDLCGDLFIAVELSHFLLLVWSAVFCWR